MQIALTSFDDFHNADDNGLAAFEHWIDQARKDEQERIGYKQAAELEALSLRIESGIEIEEIPEIEI